MSYRFEIENCQPFGNYDCPTKILDYLRECGVKFRSDNPEYDNYYECDEQEIPVGKFDIMKLIELMEEYVLEVNPNCYDLTKSKYSFESHLDFTFRMIEDSYMFAPYQLIQVLLKHNKIKRDVDSDSDRFYCYKQIAPITVKAY